jgi:tripartite-type tricarboxylate transporter receptor subunit TctC
MENCMPARASSAVWCTLVTFAVAGGALAQRATDAASFPNRPLRLVVPSAAGGGTDIIARLIAQGLNDTWGHTVVVDNRGGAGGQAGVVIVAKQSVADGHTMLLGSVGHLSFAAAVRRNLGYDVERDLAPISLTAVQPFVIAVANSVPAKTIAELITLARAKPKALSYGSGGSGAASHLGVELLQLMAGISMLHVAYKGSNPAVTAVMTNEIQVAAAGLATVLPHSRAGKLKSVAVTGEKRAQIAPEIPTVAESGVPGYKFDVWYGLVYPGGTPHEIIAKTHAAVEKLLRAPEVLKRFTGAGVEPQTNSPAAFASMIKQEIATWKKVVKAANIPVE